MALNAAHHVLKVVYLAGQQGDSFGAWVHEPVGTLTRIDNQCMNHLMERMAIYVVLHKKILVRLGTEIEWHRPCVTRPQTALAEASGRKGQSCSKSPF